MSQQEQRQQQPDTNVLTFWEKTRTKNLVSFPTVITYTNMWVHQTDFDKIISLWNPLQCFSPDEKRYRTHRGITIIMIKMWLVCSNDVLDIFIHNAFYISLAVSCLSRYDGNFVSHYLIGWHSPTHCSIFLKILCCLVGCVVL